MVYFVVNLVICVNVSLLYIFVVLSPGYGRPME